MITADVLEPIFRAGIIVLIVMLPYWAIRYGD